MFMINACVLKFSISMEINDKLYYSAMNHQLQKLSPVDKKLTLHEYMVLYFGPNLNAKILKHEPYI